jgi:hypothetical protein
VADYLVTGEFNHHSSRFADRSWRFEIWNMKQHPLEKHTFKYSRTTMLTTDWSVVIIVLIIAFGTWIIYTGDVTGGVLFISIGCGLFVPLYINAKLTLSPLCVDDDASR